MTLLWVALLGVLGTLLTATALSSPGADAVPAAVSASRSAAASYPRWYSDQNGVRVEPCIDPTDPFCVVLANPGVYDPAQPTVFPTNYPDEAFYYLLDADRLTTPGCAGTRPGTAQMRVALEMAFANGNPAAGDQIVFGRVRINVTSGLCPNTNYTFTYPYGTVTARTDGAGAIARNAGTTDIGCLAVPCNFSLPLTAPVLTALPAWDPAVAPAAPAGYLGDPGVLHPITGAPFRAGGAPANFFQVTGPGGLNLRTNLFNVAGKIAGPLQAQPEVVDAGNQPIGTPSTPRTVTFTNVGAAPLNVSAIALTPAGGAWALNANTCVTTLAVDATCTATVTFTPTVLGAATASLSLTHDSFRSPMTLSLTGVGVPAGPPAVSIAAAAVSLGRVLMGTTSGTKDVTITNAGPGTFLPTGATVVDQVPPGQVGDGAAFPIVANTCAATGVDAGTSCVIKVALTPTQQRAYGGQLQVTGTVDATPITLTSDLSGVGGLATSSTGPDGVGPDGLAVGNFPTWYQDDRGVRLSQCLNVADPNCIVLADPGFDPALPMVFPTNFPGEAFYYITDSDLMTTPGCGAASPPGKAQFRAATEQTFATGAPVDGDQMVFDRIRVNVVSGLCPGQNYTFVHPYGTFAFTADSAGGLKRAAGTTDIGCVPAPAAPCNFNDAVVSPVSDGYLRWDTGAPAGYLGDGTTLHTVAGAPYIEPGASTRANYVKVLDGAGNVVASTNLFTVMGKIDPTQTATRYQTVAPVSVAFGNQTVATTSATRTITIESVGTTPLTVTGATVTGANPADFVVTNGCAAPVAVGGTCTLTVAFKPGAAGARSGTLTIASDVANPATGSIPLTGTGVAVVNVPVLSVTPASLTFAARALGSVSPAQTVTVSNTGNAPLTVTAATVAGASAADFAAASGCALPVAPAGNCTITVTFTPSAGGARTASLSITSNGGTGTVSLSGVGSAPAISAAPAALAFTTQAVLTTSAPRTVTVTNTGKAPLTVTAATVAGANAADLTATSGCAVAVAPGATCTVSVTFRPAVTGARSATLTITSDGGTATVALSGSGAPANTAIIAVAPPSLTFVARNVGTTSPVQNVTISNTGTGPLTVATAAIGGANAGDFVLTNGCGVAVAPGGTCTLGVAFRPTVGGARTGSLAVTSNGGAVTVPLTGTGNGPLQRVTPASLTFGVFAVGVRSPGQTITITNVGNAVMSRPSVTLGGANASDFNVNNGCNNTLAAGATCTMTVTFRPRALGTRTGLVTVTSTGGTSTVALTVG